MRAKEITPGSWILYNNNEIKLGLLIKNNEQYSLFKQHRIDRYTFESLESKFGKIVWEDRKIVESKKITISKLPINSDEAFDIREEDDIPTYTKTEKGKARHVPGYWGIKFADGYVSGFCPKYTTVTENDSIGPGPSPERWPGAVMLSTCAMHPSLS